MTHSDHFIKIIFILIYIIKPSLGYGFYSPLQLPFNDSSITVFGVNVEDQHIFATTNRNGVLHLEVFEVTGSGYDASVSLVEINYLGLDLIGTLVHLSTANNNIIIIGYATGSTTATAAIYERNTTNSQWNQKAEFNMATRYASILSETQIIYSSTPDWSTTMSSIGYYLKQDDSWIRVDLASFTIPSGVAAYRNGKIIAANKDDKTVRIFEQVDGNFTQVQKLAPAQDASEGTGQVWGGVIFFLNDNEFYLGNVDAQFTTVPLYLHHFVRMSNGTWEDISIIESQYMFQWPVALNNNVIISAGTFYKSKEKLLFLVDTQTFNGTNAQAPISFAYAPVYPTDGAVHAGDNFLTAIDQDKKVQFFAINPICGNGIKEANEPCDSGPNCSSFCSCKNNLTRAFQPLILDCAPICGNGYLDTDEECDAYFSDTCQANCTCQSGFEPIASTSCQAVCGNGVINEGELCDPGLDKNCNKSCSGCSRGYTLFNYTCMTDQIQVDTPTISPLSTTDKPADYVIPVAVVVPAVVVAGVIVLVVLLLKKRKAKKRKDEEHQNLANDHGTNTRLYPDQKYIPLTVAQSLMPLPFTAAPSKPNIAPAKSSISSVPEKRLDIPFKDLTLQQEIGAGAFGKVFLGEWQKVQVALKFSSVGDSDEFKQEAKLMIDLRPHPNVVQVLGLCTDSPFPILILEYCDGGSLESSVKKKALTDEQIIDCAFGIARGMLHLHLNNIVHRDLAARNILLNDGVPKISDFGMARFVEQYKEGTTASTVGPLKWMAPESLAHQAYSIKSDMWSFGCILYEIVTGQDLYEGIQPIDIYHDVTRGQLRPPVPDNAPMVIKSIMKKCFEFEPDERPTFEEVCNRLREYSQIQTVNSLAVQD